MDLRLKLRRIARKPKYTIGKLYGERNGVWTYICDTLEDRDRTFFGESKVKAETAIPAGHYQVVLTYSPKMGGHTPYKEVSNGIVPLLLNVPNFSGVRIHCGNTDKDTEGCVLLGENKVVGKVLNSRVTWTRFWKEWMAPAKKSNDKIYMTIE